MGCPHMDQSLTHADLVVPITEKDNMARYSYVPNPPAEKQSTLASQALTDKPGHD